MTEQQVSVLFNCETDRDSEKKPMLCCTVDCRKYYQYHCKHCKKTKPTKESSETFSGTSLSTLRDDEEAAA